MEHTSDMKVSVKQEIISIQIDIETRVVSVMVRTTFSGLVTMPHMNNDISVISLSLDEISDTSIIDVIDDMVFNKNTKCTVK